MKGKPKAIYELLTQEIIKLHTHLPCVNNQLLYHCRVGSFLEYDGYDFDSMILLSKFSLSASAMAQVNSLHSTYLGSWCMYVLRQRPSFRPDYKARQSVNGLDFFVSALHDRKRIFSLSNAFPFIFLTPFSIQVVPGLAFEAFSASMALWCV